MYRENTALSTWVNKNDRGLILIIVSLSLLCGVCPSQGWSSESTTSDTTMKSSKPLRSLNPVVKAKEVIRSLFEQTMRTSSDRNHFSVIGVQGALLTNIESRLREFAQTRSLAKESNEVLRLHIEQAMQPYGYFKPHITLKRQPLRIFIQPGPQMRITNLHIGVKGDGADNPAIKKALKECSIHQGSPFNSVQYEDAKQSLLTAAEHQGYLHASFEQGEILIDQLHYTAQIHLVLNTGAQYYFGQVIFDPTSISPDLLHRYVPFKYGQPFSSDQLLALNNQLSMSGYFRNITLNPQTEDNAPYIPVEAHLQPVPRLNYSLGIGYGTDTGIRGRAGFHITPVNQAGHKFNLMALGSFNQSALQAQYILPGQNPVIDQYSMSAHLSSMNYNAGYSEAVLLSLAQQHRLSAFQRTLSLNGLHEHYHYTRRPKEDKTTLYPKGSFSWLNTEDKLFSPSGYNITLTGLGAAKALLSQENLMQVSLNTKAALTLSHVRTRFYFHTIQGLTDIKDINELPLSLALLLGGAENLKAYSFNSIGPGKITTYFGFELQKETIDHWYFVGFFDSGDVYRPSFKTLKNDVGAGLMWVSPLGPIKIGIAQAVDSRFHRQEKNPRLVISMGPDL